VTLINAHQYFMLHDTVICCAELGSKDVANSPDRLPGEEH